MFSLRLKASIEKKQMVVPFHKPYITKDEINEVINSLKSGWITMGPRTFVFERNFGKYIKCKNAIAVNSCTSALHLALKAIGLREGDEVIVPTFTFAATAEVACYIKAKPVLIDVERGTCNIDIKKIEEKITSKTKVIIPVHYGGQPCNMDEIIDIAKKYNLYVIEDAAHALPAWYKKKMIGTIGDITCFSFYATKTLATGEGGMITTKNSTWATKMRLLRLHGISNDAWSRQQSKRTWYYEIRDMGYKYNMNDIQAALGLAQLKKVDWMLKKRERIAETYTKAFKKSEFIMPPEVKLDRKSAWHLYGIKLNLDRLKINRAEFMKKLKARGILTNVHFIPLHKHPFYRNTFGYCKQDFPHAEWIYERIISLPIYVSMKDSDVEYVIENILDIAARFKR
jgi:dTDP-4-amino-4,6-dideoxygalactose transaminase